MKTKLLSAMLIASSVFSYAQTTVTSSVTQKVWMDRNLGATQVATSLTDADAAGDLYQWGRKTDGHQLRTATVASSAGTVEAGNEGDMVIFPGWVYPGDWLTTQDITRWQAEDKTNNPCPSGFRVPTSAEFIAEGITDGASAFASDLKLPYTGNRSIGDGSIIDAAANGVYWTSTVNVNDPGLSDKQFFSSTSANNNGDNRGSAMAIRCIQEEATAGIEDVLLLGFEMYPNPAVSNTKINFKVSNAVKNVKVFVYDVTGRVIHSQNNESRTINLSGTSKGMYLVKFVLDNKATIVKELIIK